MMRSVLKTKFKPGNGFATMATMRFASKKIKVELESYDTHLFDQKRFPKVAETSGEELMEYFKQMYEMRRMEIVCDILYKAREIRGFCHLYDGQEAVAVGLEAALTWEDHLITAYRDHCQQLGRGDTVYRIIAEMMGRRTGSADGKGGSMHLYMRKNNFYGGNGIVGAQVPVGTGVAFGIKYDRKPNVCVAMYGDGAANQGQLFEAANMAKLWDLPMIYICENNDYAMGTPTSRHCSAKNFYSRVPEIPGMKINGQDLFHVREGLKAAKEWCITGNGPLFVEMSTYRYHGHSMSDPGISYRSKDEVAEVRSTRDPIIKIKNLLIENDIATEKDLKDIEKQIKKSIDADVEKIKKDPFPVESDLWTHIYSKGEKAYARGREYNETQFH